MTITFLHDFGPTMTKWKLKGEYKSFGGNSDLQGDKFNGVLHAPMQIL